jgi:hypothetical protein
MEIFDSNAIGDERRRGLDLFVEPGSKTATTRRVDARIERTAGGSPGTDGTLDGERHRRGGGPDAGR